MNAAPTFLQCLRELVATPSVSSTLPALDMSNRAMCELLANWLEPLGFQCEFMPLEDQPHKCNLIATRGRGEGGLVLSGHTDTVPFDESGWDSDPFMLRENGQVWHGLGSCDMKGFLALCVELAGELKDHKLDRPLVILATADEESGMDGAVALQRSGRCFGRHALIGEPTGLQPIRMHKGIFMDALRIDGKAGHSSRPDAGVNALVGMHKALGVLLQIRDELRNRSPRQEFSVPYSTLNPGCIHGGDSPNRIPAHCELQFDLRPVPGMDLAELRSEIRQRMDAALADGGWRWEHKELFAGIDPFETPAQAAIVQLAEQLTGSEASAVNFATEGPYFNQMGMDTLVLGPGSIDQAHQPNEYLAMDQIAPMQTILRGMVNRFCIDG